MFLNKNLRFPGLQYISYPRLVRRVSEASNKYTHLFLVEREYLGFDALESVIVE
jgi:hypothetical protein